MATESFDRKFVIQPEDLDRFLNAISTPSVRCPANPNLDIDEELRRGRELLDKYLSAN